MGIPVNSLRGQEILAYLAGGNRKVAPPDPEPPVAGTHRIVIPDFVPCPLNRLLSAHWAVAARLKKADRDVIATHAAEQQVPKVTIVRSDKARKTGTGKPTVGRMKKGTGPKRRVTIIVTLAKGERRYDNDALQKVVWDALVATGYLVNDSPVWCESGGDPVWKRGEVRQTVIELEDLET